MDEKEDIWSHCDTVSEKIGLESVSFPQKIVRIEVKTRVHREHNINE